MSKDRFGIPHSSMAEAKIMYGVTIPAYDAVLPIIWCIENLEKQTLQSRWWANSRNITPSKEQWGRMSEQERMRLVTQFLLDLVQDKSKNDYLLDFRFPNEEDAVLFKMVWQ